MKRFRLPILLVVAAFLIGGAAWTRFDTVDSSAARPDLVTPQTDTGTVPTGVPTTAVRATTTVAAPTTTIAPNPEAYANALFDAWKQRERVRANNYAAPDVVKHLFARFWHEKDAWKFQGCDGAAGSTYCTWTTEHRNIVMQVRNPTGGLRVLVIGLTTKG